ncbi:FYVE and coiled-coil domain-containing protein 1-like isoform X1 [Hydractinia symbiolongicarpus]|uniref:FYVE and coiled-coil domain-containing protein 1-like isoform X1 n=1 Tax=Hydractinia symbiolongicarpus TaxID=13093 RepID=UPI00254D822B|nr:FYVE and coiled-coil domain-containing protein 1-like isoform X1 [Hydractinia symbiolongicarpus]
MNRAVFSPPEKLVFDVQGVIVELKKEYFTHKTPLTDNETLVHKLCVRLENVLRYGLREKYTFMGSRKDYWNYVNDCLPKDETVKFIQSYTEFKSYQGKGRAFLRQALMEKSLADALQRCTINDRLTREYYVTDSVFRNDQLLRTLMHSLYDLNAVDFQLPHKGYDLDRSFPSFARKSFADGKRRSSTTSTFNDQDIPADPVVILNKNINKLVENMTTWLGKETESVQSESSSLQTIIDRVIVLNEDVIKLKLRKQNELDALNEQVLKLKEEKSRIENENDLRLKQLNERYANLQQLDSSATNDKLKELYEKVTATELELNEYKAKCSLLSQDMSSLHKQVDTFQEENEHLKSENADLSNSCQQSQNELTSYKLHEHSHECTSKILENKMVELQKINDTAKVKEKELNEKLINSESKLKVKENELLSLQEAFQKSTGLVVGSFKELRDELNNQLKEKTEVLHNVTSTNEDLAKSLVKEKSDFENVKNTLTKNVNDAAKRQEEAEKIVSELKLKLAEEMKHHVLLQEFVSKVFENLNGNDETDHNADSEDGLLKKSKKKKKRETVCLPKISSEDEQHAALQRLMELQEELIAMKLEKKEGEEEITALKYELASITKNFEEIQQKSETENKEKDALEKKCEELQMQVNKSNVEVDKYNGEIFNMSLDVSKLNEQLVNKEDAYEKVKTAFEELQPKFDEVSQKNKELEEIKQKNSEEIESLYKRVEEMTQENFALHGQVESSTASQVQLNEETEFLKKEMENAVEVKNQEIQGLKFQLSTEEMKRETLQKELVDTKKAKHTLMQDLTDRDEMLSQIESKQAERDVLLLQIETLKNENVELKEQTLEMKEKRDVGEKEITFLKIEVTKLAKEKEEEKATRINGWNRLNNLVEEKKKSDEQYRTEIAQLQRDIDELKNHLVSVTKDKHELWTKKDHLEFEMKMKADERWVKDEEVKNCTNCQQAFSLTVRKHHCRLCGHIFCNNCSNNWVQTAHSRRKKRACNVCVESQKETQGEACDVVDGDHSDDVSMLSDQISITDESFEEGVKNAPADYNTRPNSSDELLTDPFEILDPADVGSSGSFGPTEHITISKRDIINPSIIPTVGDESSDDDVVSKETIEIYVAAGTRCLVPIIVGSSKFELVWEFTSTPKDVGFGLAYKINEEIEDQDIQTCIPLSRYISHKQTVHGRMKIKNPGVYYFVFNNSYSRLTTKHVTCVVGMYRSKQDSVSSCN